MLGEPLLVVRADDGVARVLSNVCRHRGMPVAEGAGTIRRFVCPYHAWSYGRDGVLANAPRMSGKGVTAGSCRLPELRTEIWNGFIYATLGSRSGAPGTAAAELGDAAGELRNR